MPDEATEFAFDFWANLSREDPAAFEHARKRRVERLIEAAAPARFAHAPSTAKTSCAEHC